MKTKIPDELKADLPQSTFGKILAATPVVMAVVATLLAGLATREMTIAQYTRSLAAQQQSKAGDQWNFFQAKKLRSQLQRNTVEIIGATGQLGSLDTGAVAKLDVSFSEAGFKQSLDAVQSEHLPTPAPLKVDDNIQAAMTAFVNQVPEEEFTAAVIKVDEKALEATLRAAIDRTHAFDTAIKPLSTAVDKVEAALIKGGNGMTQVAPPLQRDFTATRLRFAAARYDAEARLNQTVATIYELQVKKSNLSAERHHKRSQQFFFGMLSAQAAVIIATFAMAARKRNLLWSIAAAAGITAVAFASYIYFFS
ncbi:MAG: hypothetical protein JWO95_413 [Verrucomicrobiales bacterium]|nr:hypothetical protein [Verrucomicrobiales bacterium]